MMSAVAPALWQHPLRRPHRLQRARQCQHPDPHRQSPRLPPQSRLRL